MTHCPSVCPETPPNTNDVCESYSPEYVCRYTYPPLVVDDEPITKACWCNLGIFSCNSNGNHCSGPCPAAPLVQSDACSEFDDGYFNYTLPCCLQGGDRMCIPNSTCFCDEAKGSVNCTALPLMFCSNATNATSGGNRDHTNSTTSGGNRNQTTNSTSGGNRGQTNSTSGGDRSQIGSFLIFAILVVMHYCT